MQIKDSKYHKVWKVVEENGMKKVDLGDSKKNQDGTYENWSWFGCLLVGNAKDVEVQEGDTVTIKSGLVQKRKYKDKYYDNVVIFAIEVTDTGGKMNDDYVEDEDVFDEINDEDMSDLPF